MRVNVLLVASMLALSTCVAPASVTSSLDETGDLCWWKNSRWSSSSAQVRIEGVPTPIGWVHGSSQQPLIFNATLRQTSPGRTTLEGTLHNSAVRAPVMFDLTRDPVLSLTRGRALTPWLHVSREASVAIVGGSTGQPLISTLPDVREHLQGAAVIAAPERCENLTVTRGTEPSRADGGVRFPESIEAMGLTDTGAAEIVESEGRLEVRETPEGPAVTQVRVEKDDELYVVGTRGSATRIVIGYDGVWVVGWVDSAALKGHLASGGVFGMLGLGGLMGASPGENRINRRICTQAMPLGVRIAGQVHPWATLQANVPVTPVGDVKAGWVNVSMHDFSFHGAHEAELVMPESLVQCPPLSPDPLPIGE